MTAVPTLRAIASDNIAGDKSAFKELPQNLEAEQALLGAILLDNRTMEKIGDRLMSEHFFDPVHQRIYGAVTRLIERGQLANPVTLKAYFDRDPELAQLYGQDGEGSRYLAELAANVVTLVNAVDYANRIHDAFLRRQLIQLGEETISDAFDYDLEIEAKDQIESAEKKLFELATTGDLEKGFVRFDKPLAQAIETAQKAFNTQGGVTGITTGLRDIDKKLGGLHPSDLLILAGRPSMGKTALATNMAFNAANRWLETGGEEGGCVAFFSLEMSAEQLATRILADVVEISGDRIRRGDLKDSDFPKFVEASQRLAGLPLYIDDTPALSVQGLRTKARRLQRTSGLHMIVVDYLQLMRGSNSRGNENRVQEVSEITRGLKGIAKELDVPVLALSQLSRQVENREDKRPQLSDLRESGSIEQDADAVMFVYREQYYLERAEPSRRPEEGEDKFNERHESWLKRCEEVHNTAECVIAKQRHGPIGIVRLYFDGQFTRFGDLDTTYNDAIPE